MLNSAAVANSVYDYIGGNISDFYAMVDEAIVQSECVKGMYKVITQPALGIGNSVETPHFCWCGLSTSGPVVVDLDNSYITAEPQLTLSLDVAILGIQAANASQLHGRPTAFFVGWKSAKEALSKYEILVNSSVVYTQEFNGPESFIQDQIVMESVRNTSPMVYTSYANTQKFSTNVCGTYVVFENLAANGFAANTQFTVRPKIKIPLTHFPILKNLKYLFSWMGKFEIRLYFNPSNLVVCSINPLFAKDMYGICDVAFRNQADNAIVRPTVGFTQIGDRFDGITNVSVQTNAVYAANGNIGSIPVDTVGTGPSRATVEPMVWTCHRMETFNIESNLATYMIRHDICENLKSRYAGSNKPLTFPVSAIQISRFSGVTNLANLQSVLSQGINNCDTLFLLIPESSNQTTVFRNPYLRNFQIMCGEFGAYPEQAVNTYNDPKFLNMVADALNVNSSELTSFNISSACSFNSRLRFWTFVGGAGGNILNGWSTDPAVVFNAPFGGVSKTDDDSNFFIGVPFSVDNDYQGGLSAPSANINFKLSGSADPAYNPTIANWTSPIIACFLLDASVMIKPDPYGEASRVIYSDRSIV